MTKKRKSNLEILIQTAVREAFDRFVAERELKAKAEVPPASNNKELMAKLISQGRSDDEILEIFKARYAQEGKTDEEWIEARVRIYQRLAQRTQRNRSRRRKARHAA